MDLQDLHSTHCCGVLYLQDVCHCRRFRGPAKPARSDLPECELVVNSTALLMVEKNQCVDLSKVRLS